MRDEKNHKKPTWRERILARKRRITTERRARTRALNEFNRMKEAQARRPDIFTDDEPRKD